MKIAQIIPAYIPARRYGGPIVSVHGLCRSLVSLGHEVHVFTTNLNVSENCDVPLNSEVVIDGVKVRYFPVPAYGRRIYYAPQLERCLNHDANQYDIFHVHTMFNWTTWISARIARAHKIPYVVSPRGMLINEMIQKKSKLLKLGWIYFMDRNNLERAAAIHFTADSEEQDTSSFSFLRLPTGFTVPNGLDPDIASAVEAGRGKKTGGKELRILCLSRMHWKKGLDRMILAMKHITAGAQLIIAGNDEENYTQNLKNLAMQHDVIKRVNFVNAVYGDDKIKLLESADIFVLPSHSENFGNAALEAMALGCPVVVTPEVGLSEIIKAKNAGLVVKGEPYLLAQAVNQLLDNKELRIQLGHNASKLALSEFHPHRVAQLMEKEYKKILHANSRN